MSSFYGGKQGRTYHIVQRYDSVEQMVNAFSGGGAYTDANYGQYVIIDTIMNLNRKSDPENGLLYRRGFDYNDSASNHPKPSQQDYLDVNHNLKKDEWQAAWSAWVNNPGGGAIYVGQIVGPQGDTPELIPVQWDEIKDTAGVKTIIPVSTTRGDDTTVIQTPAGTVYNGDTVKTASLTLRDNGDNITGAKVAFDIPTLVTEVVANQDDNLSFTGQVEEDQISQGRPFYYKWNFSIPQVTDFVKEEGSQISGYTKDAEGNDIDPDDEYITYKVHNANAAGAVSQHLGRWPYRLIDSITQDQNIRTFFTWTNNTTAEKGVLYYLGDVTESQDIYVAICITPGTVGTVPDFNNPSYTQNVGKIFQSNDTQWLVTTIPETAPAHVNRVNYKAGADDTFETHEVDYIFMDGTGKMFVVYAGSNTAHFLTQLYSIKNISSDAGWVTINYFNDSKQSDRFHLPQDLNITYNQDYSYFTIDYWESGEHKGTSQRYYIKQVTNISFKNQNDINQEQKFVATYKGVKGDVQYVTEDISKPINQILAIGRQGDNILVLYSDPNVRMKIDQDHRVTVPSWTDPATDVTYTNLDWYNFGPLGAQYHVQGEYTYIDIKPGGDLENGFSGDLEDRAGWLITITDSQNNKHIYAYDYNGGTHTIGETGDTFESSWYELMDITASNIDPSLFVQVSETEPTGVLMDNMLWFVESRGHDNY